MNVIPTYALYGEAESETDWLHWENIQSRSRLHRYRIAPHRHERFAQVLILERGDGVVTLDGSEYELAPTSVVFVPALTVHGYRFSADVDGLVLTLLEAELRATGQPVPGPMTLRRDLRPLTDAAARLIREARERGAGHDSAMRAHLCLLAVELNRARRHEAEKHAPDRAMTLALAFREQVEQRFRATRRIGDYAAAIGISPTHLNRVCRQVTGRSALSLIESRIALEARRMLMFSTLSIKQIGAELGYEDPAYFSRFLTRVLHRSPGAFRRERNGLAVSAQSHSLTVRGSFEEAGHG